MQMVKPQEPVVPHTNKLRAAEMPMALQELVPGAESSLKARSGEKSELYSRDRNCPLAQNLNINCRSALCFTKACVTGIRYSCSFYSRRSCIHVKDNFGLCY